MSHQQWQGASNIKASPNMSVCFFLPTLQLIWYSAQFAISCFILSGLQFDPGCEHIESDFLSDLCEEIYYLFLPVKKCMQSTRQTIRSHDKLHLHICCTNHGEFKGQWTDNSSIILHPLIHFFLQQIVYLSSAHNSYFQQLTKSWHKVLFIKMLILLVLNK